MKSDATNKTKPDDNVTDEKTGIKAFLDKALQSYDKLPMLEIIFEKFTRQLIAAFRNLTPEAVHVEVQELTSMRFESYFKTIPSPSSIIVFKAIEWENLGLLVLDSNLVFAFVDVLLGGKKQLVASQQKSDTARVLTSIEQGIARQIGDVFLNELSSAFASVSPTTFSFERIESNPNFATIARPGDAIIVLKINIEVDGRGEHFDLVIPYKTIEPIKEQMQQVFLGDKFGIDESWGEAMVNTIQNVDFPIEAVIINKPSTLHEVANLKIGDTIVMDHKQDEDITVRCGNVSLFRGQIGKVDGMIAVSLKNQIEKE